MSLFTEEHHMFRKTLRDFVEREINPHAEAWEEAGTFPAHELFPKLGELGVLGLTYDPAYGGGGSDYGYVAIMAEEFGRMPCLGVAMAIGVQTDMATPSLARFGTHELKEQFLAPAISGQHVAAVAVTEPDAGSDVAGIRTKATRDGDEWVINGAKTYITSGIQADWVCLLVRTSDEGGSRGVSQVIVPTDTPGFIVSRKLDKLGMRSSDTAELSFDNMRVPVANTIGEIGRGFQQQMSQFQDERMIASYQMVGAMEYALERTADYLKQRMAFGKPLLANQHLAYELADLASEVDLLKYYNYNAAVAQTNGEDITRFATVAKLRSARLARKVADICLQFHGGIGYMEETWTARFFRDTRLWSIGGGADEVMLRTLARVDGYWVD